MLKSDVIDVDLQNGSPRGIRLGKRVYRVRRVLDSWVLQTRWWGREEKRVYFRLDTDRGVIEIYRSAEFTKAGVSGVHPPSSIHHPPSSIHPPVTTETDTHTRELRRTDSAYRPDAKHLKSSRSSMKETRSRWVLSKVID